MAREDTVLCLNLTKKLNQKIYYHPSLVVYHHRRAVLIKHLQQLADMPFNAGFLLKNFPKLVFVWLSFAFNLYYLFNNFNYKYIYF